MRVRTHCCTIITQDGRDSWPSQVGARKSMGRRANGAGSRKDYFDNDDRAITKNSSKLILYV